MGSLSGQAADDTCDQPVHAGDGGVVQRAARQALAAGVVDQRRGERLELAGEIALRRVSSCARTSFGSAGVDAH